MPEQYFVLDENDKRLFQSLLEWFRKQGQSNPTIGYVEQDRLYPASNCYVAKVPTGGIPPIDRAGNQPGSAAEEEDNIYDTPGSALCNIYEMRPRLGTTKTDLIPISGYQERVYNISQTWVDSLYIIIKREQFGFWVYECPCIDITGTGTTGTGTTGTGTTGTSSTGTSSTGTSSTGTSSTGTASTGTASTGTGSTGTATASSTSTFVPQSSCVGNSCYYKYTSGTWVYYQPGPVYPCRPDGTQPTNCECNVSICDSIVDPMEGEVCMSQCHCGNGSTDPFCDEV